MSNQLIEAQRYEICLGLKRKWSKNPHRERNRGFAFNRLREVKRNSKPNGEYVWKYAQAKCDSRKHGLNRVAVPLSANMAYDYHGQRKRVCCASRNHKTAKPER